MISFLVGVALTVVSGALFWRMRARNGVPHRLAATPFLETALPLAITSGLVLGIAMTIAGVTSAGLP